MLEEISGMYSSVFGTKAGPDREKHPVVFLPDGSKKACRPSGQMSSMGYLAFAVSLINSVVNAANNINNNDNNNNNNNNDNNNVNIQNSNNNQNNMNMLIAGRQLPVDRLLELQERLARHHKETSSKAKSNVTLLNIRGQDPLTGRFVNRTVLVPPQPQLLQQKERRERKETNKGGMLDIFERVVGGFLPGLSRSRRHSESSKGKEEEVCR